jgi:hypothetical protein
MAIIYVDSNATGAANGTSWADAYVTLTAALAADANDDFIYVAFETHDNQVDFNKLSCKRPEAGLIENF